MTESQATPSVADALRGFEALQQEAQERHQAQLAELDQEIARIQGTIDNLQAQLAAVQQSRERAAAAGAPAAGGGYARIFKVLKAQSAALATRNGEWRTALEALEAQRRASLETDEMKAVVAEVEQFRKEVEPNLDNLPGSYRQVPVAHHASQTEKLRAHLAAQPTVPSVEGDGVAFDLILAVDADEEGGVAMVVTPVPATVDDWRERAADLHTLLAARIFEGIYTGLRGAALEATQAMHGPHQGLLAIEFELPPGHAEGVAEQLTASLSRSMQADDLVAAKVEGRIVRLSVDLLLPPEEEVTDG